MIKVFTKLSFTVGKPFYLLSTLSSGASTIYALSSGVNSAISIVRVSGPQTYKVLTLLKTNEVVSSLSRDQLLDKHRIRAREMTLKSIYNHHQGLIDKCLLVYFPADHSYSGQDMIELHLHGSRAVVAEVFRELARLQFSVAKRGEFTRRAVINNRMNLQQAEAVGDLVESHLEFERQVAVSNLVGKNKAFLDQIRQKMIRIVTVVEAFIEFEEEQVGSGLLTQAKQQIRIVLSEFSRVLESSKQLQSAREGAKISIVGSPNVGKSTLINALMGRDIAIVSPIPGTTRDLIQSELEVQGFRVKIVDTAGLRDSTCLIEQQGMRRTRLSIDESNFVLILFDIAAAECSISETEMVIHPQQEEKQFLDIKNSIVIVNKIDTLPAQLQKKIIRIQKNDGKVENADLVVSLKSAQNVELVLARVGEYLKNKFNLCSKGSSEIYFTRARYIEGITKCCHLLEGCQEEVYADLVSGRVKNSLEEVEELLGRVDSQQILDSVFNSFCIGK